MAHTQRWVRIDVATLRRMLDAGTPLSAGELAELLRAALYADEVDVVRTLLEIGADAHTLPGNEHTGPDKPLKIARSAGATRAR